MVALTVGMVFASVILVVRLRVALIDGLDTSVRQRAAVIAAQLDQTGGDGINSGLPANDMVVQVVDSSGRVIASSAEIAADSRLFDFPGTSQRPTARTASDLPGLPDENYRVVAVTAGPQADPVTVYVAASAGRVDDSVNELVVALAVGLPVMVALLTWVCWLLVGRALRPVEALRRQAAQITVTDLRRRLELSPANDEIHRLGATLNDLLERLDTSTNRQRQFVADAAHELRSPLAALRAELEVALHHPESTRRESLEAEVLSDLERLTRLVDDLVRLARLDASPTLRRVEVDLDDIVREEVRRARARSDVPIEATAVGAARLVGDHDALARAVGNIVDNATRHARSRVVISLATDRSTATLLVSDDGPGIPAADRLRVLERFTRLDDARSRDAGGSGLGLAIVNEVTAAHGGTVVIEDNKPGARVRLRLPLAPCLGVRGDGFLIGPRSVRYSRTDDRRAGASRAQQVCATSGSPLRAATSAGLRIVTTASEPGEAAQRS